MFLFFQQFALKYGLKFLPFQGKRVRFQVWHYLWLFSRHIIIIILLLLLLLLLLLKAKCPVFHFLDLDGTILNLIQKFAKKTKVYIDTLMISIFLLKTAARLWKLCPHLSIHDTLRLDLVGIKIDSQQAVKKLLDLAGRMPKNQR